MKLRHIILAAAALALASAPADARSNKRGVCAKFSYIEEMQYLEPGCFWWYNWGQLPGSGFKGELKDYDSSMAFIPMCWNGNYSADDIRSYCKAHPEVKYLLGFNEPNFKAQANMTPAEAAEKWPEVQALAKELGLQLVAPALNYSPDAPYTDPTRWMDEFVALVGSDAFDFTAIHNYGGLGVMKTLGGRFHDKYGKPVWVTEFCQWPGGAGNVFVAPDTQIASMVETLEWLEKTPWIHAYSWFMAQGPYNASNRANYGLVANQVDENGRVVVVNGRPVPFLTPQGKVYAHLWDFDPEYAHPVGERFSAADFHARSSALVNAGACPDAPKPIEISQFNAGATLDYRFDIPEAGDYTLELVVSGVGEPVRFDPHIAVVEAKEDGSEGAVLAEGRKFTLPGADDSYKTETFSLTLPAGIVTLRLKDLAVYQPSGIRISSLRLVSTAGIDAVAVGPDAAPATVDVFDLLGRRIRSGVDPAAAATDLPAGIYVIGGKKVSVRN